MNYNLLQKYYDYQCKLFYDGVINYAVFEELEYQYNLRKELFTINLN